MYYWGCYDRPWLSVTLLNHRRDRTGQDEPAAADSHTTLRLGSSVSESYSTSLNAVREQFTVVPIRDSSLE